MVLFICPLTAAARATRLFHRLLLFHHLCWSSSSAFGNKTMDHQAHHQADETTGQQPSPSLQASIDLLLPESLPPLSEAGHLDFEAKQQQQQFLASLTDSKRGCSSIVVEGNIGAGKTTFLRTFAQVASARNLPAPLIVPEPITLWRNVGGVNAFQLLADDPKRWSFAFQSYVQLTMLKIHDLQPVAPSHLKIMERSLFSARYCFVENLRAGGLLSEVEFYILDQWFRETAPATKVDLIIYLRSDPELLFARIKARGRPEETGLSLEYLRALHELHEDWLVRGKYGEPPAPVYIIDANTPREKVVALYQAKTDHILRERLPAILKQEA